MQRVHVLFVFGALLLAGEALAAPRNIDDCEAIKEPDAYNHCLASFGPVRGGRGKHYGAASDARHGVSRHGRNHPSDVSSQRAHSGRVRMEFTPDRGR
jgi:hypothetical protein